jgi:hypothetical protein
MLLALPRRRRVSESETSSAIERLRELRVANSKAMILAMVNRLTGSRAR